MSNNNKVYHNSTSLEGQELQAATERAKTQSEIILDLYKKHPEPKTPFEVAVLLIKQGYKYPITSVRARMTGLTKDGFLFMSARADAIGNYDAKNHTWRLKGYQAWRR